MPNKTHLPTAFQMQFLEDSRVPEFDQMLRDSGDDGCVWSHWAALDLMDRLPTEIPRPHVALVDEAEVELTWMRGVNIFSVSVYGDANIMWITSIDRKMKGSRRVKLTDEPNWKVVMKALSKFYSNY